MLAAALDAPSMPHSHMHHRGRSRLVSPVALARHADEQRALEDQIQAAYALDNFRLARILLLRLKGIHVLDDADPRIDQVRDEDFDVCFAPSRPLSLDDATTLAVQESQRRQRLSWHESQRAQRLRACEKLWHDERSRLHDDKRRALERRDLDAVPDRPRATKSRVDPPPSVKRDPDPFQYAFMPPSSSSALPCRSPKSPKKHLSSPHNRSVSFKDVISAMNGKLFPPDPSERADDARRTAGVPISAAAPHKRKASVRAELLDSLLQVVEWQDGERRKAKGKDVDRSQLSKPSLPPSPPLLSVPSSLSATSLSSSASPSRSSSWLSFGSWRSTATDITVPDSPVLLSPTSQPCLLPTLIDAQPEFHPRCAFVRVSLEDTPLSPPHTSHSPLEDVPTSAPVPPTEPISSLGIPGALVVRLTRSVTTIVEAAKGLQSAYISAAMFAAGHPYQDTVTARALPRRALPSHHQLRHQGYRALTKDVRTFTDAATPISQACEPVHFIPLVSPPSASPTLAKPPPHKNALIFPSPLRPRTPPAALAYRMRPVANPAVLRLRALQNLMCARGKEWEGRAREGGLGCGKERMLGVAFEGRGRSGLGCEVRFVVA